jgi:hypothetical protein
MKKVLKIFALVIGILVLVLASILYFISKKHHRTAHEELVQYLNDELGGQVTFRDFSLSYLRHFPKIHVELLDVSIRDGEQEILKIGDLDIMLATSSIWKKQIRIHKVILSDVTFSSITDSLGRSPRLLAAKSPSADSSHKALIINARKIEVRNGLICFRNDVKRNHTQIRVHHADLKLRASDSVLTITGFLDGHLDSLISNNSLLFADLPVAGKDIHLEINRKTGIKELKKGYLKSNSVVLTPRLRMQPHEDGQMIELHISGHDNFDAILALFQFHIGFDLAQVNPSAKLNLSYNQKGFVNPFKRPFSELDFEISDAIFEGEDLPFPIELIQVKGNYNNGEAHSPQTVELAVDTLYAEVSESYIGGHFKLTNLHDPVIDAYLVSNLDISHLVGNNNNFSLTGMIDLELSVNGKLSELRKLHMEGKQHARAEINFNNLELVLKETGHSFQILNGTTTLNNHILEISSIVGAFNNSAFHFQGHVENLDQYLLSENEQLIGKLILNFDEIDLTKLDFKAKEKEIRENPSRFPFSLVAIELLVNGKKVITPIGDLENISTDLLLVNDLLKIGYLRFDYQEGHMESSGEIKFDENGIAAIDASLAGDFKNLEISFPRSKPEEEKKPDGAFNFPDYINTHVDLHIDKGTIAQIPVNQLSLDANLKGKEIALNEFQVNAYDGKISATGKISFDSTGLDGIWLKAAMDFNHLKPLEIANSLELNSEGKKKRQKFTLPEKLDISLDFHAKKLSYLDLSLSNTGFSLHGDNKNLEISDMHSNLPFGHFDLDATVQDYLSGDISYQGEVTLAIDTLSITDLFEKEYMKSLTGDQEKQIEESGKDKRQPVGLPDNIDLSIDVTAEQLIYENFNATDIVIGLDYSVNGIDLEKLDLAFAGGKIHLDGQLKNENSKSYPGYLYLNASDLDMKLILESFDNFDQDKFTASNSSGKISSASHHYFTLGKDLAFIRDANFWLGKINIHHAEFDQVEPIEKTLFFVGHKVKDTMIVSELNINLLLAKDKLYFRDILMNDNIANLKLTGLLDIDDREIDIAAEISMTDLFFRSKKERVAETREGVITLDEDAKIFLKLHGPLSDHKINLMKRRKFELYQVDMLDDISLAEKEYRKQQK